MIAMPVINLLKTLDLIDPKPISFDDSNFLYFHHKCAIMF